MPETTAYKVEGGIRTARLDPDALAFKQYRKTTLSDAVQMDHDFMVETLEGVMEGHAGDYLMRGAQGELYPCAKEVFDQTYEHAEFGNHTDRTCIGMDATTNYGGYAKVMVAPDDVPFIVEALQKQYDEYQASLQAVAPAQQPEPETAGCDR